MKGLTGDGPENQEIQCALQQIRWFGHIVDASIIDNDTSTIDNRQEGIRLLALSFWLLAVGDFSVVGVSVLPDEANAVLVVNPDATPFRASKRCPELLPSPATISQDSDETACGAPYLYATNCKVLGAPVSLPTTFQSEPPMPGRK
jgi:hypothetical protein